MNIDSQWINVVKEPLGLAGFALFLIFLVLSRVAHHSQRRQIIPVFLAIAAASLLVGLGLAYQKHSQKSNTPTTIITFGDSSPGVGNNTGTIQINNGNPSPSTSKPDQNQ